MFWLRVSAKFSVSLSMSTMMEVSQTLWRLFFLPRKITFLLFPPRSLLSMKCRGLVAGRTLRTESAQLAIDSRETPGPRIAWALANTAGVRWRSAMLATTAWPSTPQPNAGFAKTRETTMARVAGPSQSLRFIGTPSLAAMMWMADHW